MPFILFQCQIDYIDDTAFYKAICISDHCSNILDTFYVVVQKYLQSNVSSWTRYLFVKTKCQKYSLQGTYRNPLVDCENICCILLKQNCKIAILEKNTDPDFVKYMSDICPNFGLLVSKIEQMYKLKHSKSKDIKKYINEHGYIVNTQRKSKSFILKNLRRIEYSSIFE